MGNLHWMQKLQGCKILNSRPMCMSKFCRAWAYADAAARCPSQTLLKWSNTCRSKRGTCPAPCLPEKEWVHLDYRLLVVLLSKLLDWPTKQASLQSLHPSSSEHREVAQRRGLSSRVRERQVESHMGLKKAGGWISSISMARTTSSLSYSLSIYNKMLSRPAARFACPGHWCTLLCFCLHSSSSLGKLSVQWSLVNPFSLLGIRSVREGRETWGSCFQQ